jgi:hypothetical protein
MILTAPREGTCDFPLWATQLLCDREPGHLGAHTYHSSDCPDGRHDDGADES